MDNNSSSNSKNNFNDYARKKEDTSLKDSKTEDKNVSFNSLEHNIVPDVNVNKVENDKKISLSDEEVYSSEADKNVEVANNTVLAENVVNEPQAPVTNDVQNNVQVQPTGVVNNNVPTASVVNEPQAPVTNDVQSNVQVQPAEVANNTVPMANVVNEPQTPVTNDVQSNVQVQPAEVANNTVPMANVVNEPQAPVTNDVQNNVQVQPTEVANNTVPMASAVNEPQAPVTNDVQSNVQVQPTEVANNTVPTASAVNEPQTQVNNNVQNNLPTQNVKDEKALPPKKKGLNKILIIILLVVIILIVVFVIIGKTNKNKDKDNVKNEVVAVSNYIQVSDVNTSNYLNVYKEAKIKRVRFLNVSEILTNDFYNKQDEFINTVNQNLISNKEYIENYKKTNNINNYILNSTISTLVLADIKDDILSVIYLIEDNLDYRGTETYITNTFINLKNNAIVTNDNILSKYNVTKNEIASSIFDNILSDYDKYFSNKLTKEQLQSKKADYVYKLIENFDEYIYLYINQGNLYSKYSKKDISKLLFEENFPNMAYSTYKVSN